MTSADNAKEEDRDLQTESKISLFNLNFTNELVPAASAAVVQNIFNRAGDYAKLYFGHTPNGSEVLELLRYQADPRISELTVYEIVLEHSVSTSIGIAVVKYFPGIRQSYISLVVIDQLYRGNGIGSKVVSLLESVLNSETQYVSVKVNVAQPKTVSFWEKQGYVAERNIPSSMSPVLTGTSSHVRLVKQTSHPVAPEEILPPSSPELHARQSQHHAGIH